MFYFLLLANLCLNSTNTLESVMTGNKMAVGQQKGRHRIAEKFARTVLAFYV